MSVAEAIASAGMQKYFNCITSRLNGYNGLTSCNSGRQSISIMEVLIMEEIKVSKKEIIRFRVAEMLHKVARFVKSFSYRMEVIK